MYTCDDFCLRDLHTHWVLHFIKDVLTSYLSSDCSLNYIWLPVFDYAYRICERSNFMRSFVRQLDVFNISHTHYVINTASSTLINNAIMKVAESITSVMKCGNFHRWAACQILQRFSFLPHTSIQISHLQTHHVR